MSLLRLAAPKNRFVKQLHFLQRRTFTATPRFKMPSGGCLCRNVKYEFDTIPCENVQYAFTGEPIPNDCTCYQCSERNSHLPSTSISVRKSLFKIHSSPSNPSTLKSYTIAHPYGSTRINFCSNCGSTIYKDSEDPSFMGLDLVLVQGTTLDALEQWEWERVSKELSAFKDKDGVGAGMMQRPLTPESSDEGSLSGEVPTDGQRRGVPPTAVAAGELGPVEESQGCGCGCC